MNVARHRSGHGPWNASLTGAKGGELVVIAFWTPSPEAFDANIEAAESILEGIEFDTGS